MPDTYSPLDTVQQELTTALAPGLQVLGLIGRGAMGAVFLARDPALKRHVVVKVLAPELADDPTARNRFAREAEMAAAVSHPNVISVFHVGELPVTRVGYFIMQYIDGRTLGEACPLGTPVSQWRVRRIIGDIASALAAAHAQGLVHRDIKPSNVMLEDLTERVVVLDFGISAAASPERRAALERLTIQGTSIGTPEYMSPEQSMGEEVTTKSDVYSLGVVAFELLTGRAPFKEATAFALAAAHVKDAPPRVRSIRADVDPLVDALVDRMLAKDPSARPGAAEVARTLLPARAHIIEWPPPGLESMRGRGVTGLRWTVVAFVAATFALVYTASIDSASASRAFFAAGASLLSVGLLSVGSIALSIGNRRLRHGLQHGYPLGVVLDVLLDSRDDTPAVVNAAGVFAAVPREQVDRWFRLRRWAAGAALAGCMLTALLALLWTIGLIGLVNQDAADALSVSNYLILVAPTAAGVLVAALLGTSERRARPRDDDARTVRRRRLPAIAPELVTGWLTSASVDAPAGRRSRGASVASVVAEWAMAVVLLLAVASIVATVMLGMMRSMVGPDSTPTATQRGQWRLDAGRALVAGRRLDSLLAAASTKPTLPLDLAAARAIAASRRAPFVGIGAVWSAIRSTPPSIPPTERAAFDSAARAPTTEGFRRIAVGATPPAVWYFTGAKPGMDSAMSLRDLRFALSPPTDGLTPTAVDDAAAAALVLAGGNKADAVRRAREILAVARTLTRDPLPNAYHRGLSMAGLGARLLGEIAMATGDGALMRESSDLQQSLEARRASERALDLRTLIVMGALPGDSALLSIAGRRDYLPVDRWTAANAIVDGACANPAEMRSGVSPRRREALRLAGERMADIELSGLWIELHRRRLERLDVGKDSEGLGDVPVIGAAKPFARWAICGLGK